MKRMIYRVLLVSVIAMIAMPQTGDAQFLKKLFKKRNKTTTVVGNGSADLQQTVMLHIDSLADHSNNRNGFLGIPLGIQADNFERQLHERGFVNQRSSENQTAKSYMYDGKAFGAACNVQLILSEQTGCVYEVYVEEQNVYGKEKEVQKRFRQIKDSLVALYGKGFVGEQGSVYRIYTHLGRVTLSYERQAMASLYMIGYSIEDEKAYAKAFEEMEEKQGEESPRHIERGVAAAWTHADLIGLGTLVAQASSMQQVRTALQDYDFTVGHETAKALPATFQVGSYKCSVSVGKRGKRVAQVTLTANDHIEQLETDLQRYGYLQKGLSWNNGTVMATLSEGKSGQVVLKMIKTLQR